MRQSKYAVYLTEAERAQLRTLVGSGVAPARMLTRARILLKANQGEGGAAWADTAIAGALEVHPTTVARVRRQFVEQGLEVALERKRPDRVYARALDGAAEAQLVALACTTPPTGRERWTLRLLADELVRLEVVPAVSYETVRQTLQQTNSSRGCGSNGAFPRPTRSSSGTWKMCWTSTSDRPLPPTPSSAWMRPAGRSWLRCARRCRCNPGSRHGMIRSTRGRGWSIVS